MEHTAMPKPSTAETVKIVRQRPARRRPVAAGPSVAEKRARLSAMLLEIRTDLEALSANAEAMHRRLS